MTENSETNQRRCLLIINPVSGTSRKERVEPETRQAIEAAGMALDVRFTERAGHATEIAAEAASQGYYAVIAAGGDGTVNETARGLILTDTALGILPLGSGNGLARHMNIPLNLRDALQVIVDGKTERCDHCTVNDRPFFCTFGMGFDAAVSDRFASRPDHRGLANYVRSALEEFINYKSEEYTIRIGQELITERAFLIACCNAAQYGNNAFIAPKASVTDGVMDITILNAGTKLGNAISGIEVMAGALGENNARVHNLRAESVTIERPTSGPIHIDGEPAIMGRTLHVKCHHATLNVFSPGEMHVRPVITPLDSAWREVTGHLPRL
jgi:YegS/Rv2252/BmrU family lipid kinase